MTAAAAQTSAPAPSSAPVAKMVALSDARVLDRLLAKLEPKLRREVLELVSFLRERRSVAEIAELIRANRALEVADDEARAAGAALAEQVNAIYLAAGREVARALGEKLDTLIPLDQTNPRALRAMQRSRLRLIRDMTAEQRELIRAVVSDGLARGINPRAMARAYRSAIGLTAEQWKHVQNYRRSLETLDVDALQRRLRDRRFDRTVGRAIREGKPLTRTQVDRMVARYEQRYLKFRAEVIARTESIGALHAGAREGWEQAIDAKVIAASEIRRKWVTAADGRVRDSHASMNGQLRGFDEAFVSGSGILLLYPHDPSAPFSETVQCRCAVATRLMRGRAAVEKPTA